ncbi:nucleotide exchange factor GrpE [Telmatospirillum siberiense]|uniref:Protein GrpE n=1 Tax=Telmatospirillum siberiense TaxID=382514 RepID=A0A2N3PST4_9PROT|nr:nucleotide exchange factor GrpE [Telmatospirillum siberiense]PKU23471.1 nucleotide exchange factor GrpE [Telmatospirillum siberiense]
MTQDQPQTNDTQPAPSEAAEAQTPEAAPELSPREAELVAEVAKLKDQLLRAVAETENVRRRLEQQAEDRGKYAVGNFAKDILQVADNLRRALESIPAEAREGDPMAHKLAEGVELTERTFLNTLERYGITRIESLGKRFDPHLHQAMMEVEDTTQMTGTVVLEMQAGYLIHDRLLREAMVGVSKGGPKPPLGEGGVDTSA